MKKWKGSSLVLSGPTKRHTLSQQGPGNTTVQKPVAKLDPRIQVHCHPLNRLRANMQWQCEECMHVNEVCATLPGYTCERCQHKKNKCSLMPLNPGTGKMDCRVLEQESIQDFCIRQTEELCCAGIKQGKQRTHSSPGARKPEDSGAVLLPLATLAAFGLLVLESSGSSAIDTHSNSPATLPESSLLKVATPSPPTAPTARPCQVTKRPQGASSLDPSVTAPTQHLAAFAVEVPSVSWFLKPTHSQPSHSHSDTSQMSKDGSNSARIAVLEKKVDKLQKMHNDHECRLRNIGA